MSRIFVLKPNMLGRPLETCDNACFLLPKTMNAFYAGVFETLTKFSGNDRLLPHPPIKHWNIEDKFNVGKKSCQHN